MRKQLYVLATAAFATGLLSAKAYAFHTRHCKNANGSVSLNYLSDAKFGTIVKAELTYPGITRKYVFPSGGMDIERNHIAVIEFESGENAALSSDEVHATVWDARGLFLDQLSCS